jgi:hypothetical protein
MAITAMRLVTPDGYHDTTTPDARHRGIGGRDTRTVRPAPPGPGAPTHVRGYRYWPVLATVSIVRPGSVPCLPWMIVRM